MDRSGAQCMDETRGRSLRQVRARASGLRHNDDPTQYRLVIGGENTAHDQGEGGGGSSASGRPCPPTGRLFSPRSQTLRCAAPSTRHAHTPSHVLWLF
jgi:hypothetical protein